MMHKRSSSMPKAEREKLMALQSRYRTLLALLPTDPVALDCLDPDELDAKLADIELISSEMLAVTNAQMKILDALGETGD